ncbi:MAG: MlaD family protein [Candidatus Omnitrophota bacterium]
MRFSNEIKAGIVVVFAFTLCALFFVKTTSFQVEKYEIKTFFRYAGDLKPDAAVKLAGIEVGRLKKINFIYKPETKVECVLTLDARAKVRKDSIAYIGTAGFVGDAYIGITPGESNEFSEPGSVISSEDPVQTRLLMKKADTIANNLDSILFDIKSVVSGNKQNLNNAVTNLEATTQNFKEFSQDVKEHPWKLMFKGE